MNSRHLLKRAVIASAAIVVLCAGLAGCVGDLDDVSSDATAAQLAWAKTTADAAEMLTGIDKKVQLLPPTGDGQPTALRIKLDAALAEQRIAIADLEDVARSAKNTVKAAIDAKDPGGAQSALAAGKKAWNAKRDALQARATSMMAELDGTSSTTTTPTTNSDPGKGSRMCALYYSDTSGVIHQVTTNDVDASCECAGNFIGFLVKSTMSGFMAGSGPSMGDIGTSAQRATCQQIDDTFSAALASGRPPGAPVDPAAAADDITFMRAAGMPSGQLVLAIHGQEKGVVFFKGGPPASGRDLRGSKISLISLAFMNATFAAFAAKEAQESSPDAVSRQKQLNDDYTRKHSQPRGRARRLPDIVTKLRVYAQRVEANNGQVTVGDNVTLICQAEGVMSLDRAAADSGYRSSGCRGQWRGRWGRSCRWC